jgi:hypothetical protein
MDVMAGWLTAKLGGNPRDAFRIICVANLPHIIEYLSQLPAWMVDQQALRQLEANFSEIQ